LAEMASFTPCYRSGSFGMYIHVPFCLQKCGYCSFYSVAGAKSWYGRFVKAVLRQISQAAPASWARQRRPRTLFLGGGTPSVLPAESIVSLVRQCIQEFNCADEELEITVEVNPATIDYAGLCALRRAGVNRLSIGVQSLDDNELLCLGRVHNGAEARESVVLARRAGFTSLSLDLMYGLPGQSAAGWRNTLDQAVDLAPDHLSMYELTIESDTPFCRQQDKGQLNLPVEEEVLAMMEYSLEATQKAGLHRYEISNYARPGYECRHNSNYWLNGSYFGFGPGAVSCCSGERTTAITDVARFCKLVESGQSVITEQERLTREQRFRETVIMGLRMSCGIAVSSLEQRFSLHPVDYYGTVLKRLVDQELIVLNCGRLQLTPTGFLLANRVMSELV